MKSIFFYFSIEVSSLKSLFVKKIGKLTHADLLPIHWKIIFNSQTYFWGWPRI